MRMKIARTMRKLCWALEKCGIRRTPACFVIQDEIDKVSFFIDPAWCILESDQGLLFFLKKLVVDGINQGLPAGLDDVFRNSDGSPFRFSIP